MPKPRVVEFDILRAFAIIVIVCADLGYFLPTVGIPYNGLLADFGVALFLFISGFVLYFNHPSFSQRKSLEDFYKKRVLRIFPLYWLALVVGLFLAGVQPRFPPRIAFIIILGLQGFLSPRFGTDLMAYWWFIGVILVLYVIYPLIIALASGTLNLPAPMKSSILEFTIMLLVPFLILVAARRAFFIIDDSVFAFYGIFVLGIAFSKYNTLDKYGFLTDNRTRLLKYFAAAAVSFTALLFLYRLKVTDFANVSAVPHFASYGGFLIVKTALFLLFVLLAFYLARIMVVSSSKVSRPPSRAVWYRTLLLISFSSYAIYLFFGYILVPLMYALIGAQVTALEISIIQIFVGLPTVVLVAYLLQSMQNEIANRVRKYRTASVLASDKT